MKKTLSAVLISMLFASTALAEFTVEELMKATQLATDDFSGLAEGNAAKVSGFKVWKDGEDSRVRVYFLENGQELSAIYLCHKHDGLLECHI